VTVKSGDCKVTVDLNSVKRLSPMVVFAAIEPGGLPLAPSYPPEAVQRAGTLQLASVASQPWAPPVKVLPPAG
jgi:hypothetical protein